MRCSPVDFRLLGTPFVLETVGSHAEHAFVAGGSCVCFAKGNPLRLTLQDLVDNLVPCLAAVELGVPAVLYFQSHEALLMADVLHFDPVQAEHATMRSHLECGLRTILAARGIAAPAIQWVDTAEAAVRAALDHHAALLKEWIPREALYGLYGAVQKGDYPRGTPEEELLIEVYYRNLALYTRDFLVDIGLPLAPAQGWLALENEGQGRAMALAGLGSSDALTVRATFPVTPNRQLKEMCLGNANHKIELRSTDTQIVSRAAPLDEQGSPARGFYRTVFGQFSIPEVMRLWKSALQR